MVHTVKGFGTVNETVVDVFLEFPSFLYDWANVANFIKFLFLFLIQLEHLELLGCIMMKPSIHDFKHDLTSMGDEYNCSHALVLPF